MGIIKAVNLIFDYIRHDEEEDKDEVSHALKGVSLDIKEGDFVAILGHNGSGKSTFAKLMNGILLPTDGTVYISKMRTDDEEHLWDVRKRREWYSRTRITRSSETWWKRTLDSDRRTWEFQRRKSGRGSTRALRRWG